MNNAMNQSLTRYYFGFISDTTYPAIWLGYIEVLLKKQHYNLAAAHPSGLTCKKGNCNGSYSGN